MGISLKGLSWFGAPLDEWEGCVYSAPNGFIQHKIGAKFHTSRQCSGSMTFWYGLGSGFADPYHRLKDPDPAFFRSFLLITF